MWVKRASCTQLLCGWWAELRVRMQPSACDYGCIRSALGLTEKLMCAAKKGVVHVLNRIGTWVCMHPGWVSAPLPLVLRARQWLHLSLRFIQVSIRESVQSWQLKLEL